MLKSLFSSSSKNLVSQLAALAVNGSVSQRQKDAASQAVTAEMVREAKHRRIFRWVILVVGLGMMLSGFYENHIWLVLR
ncbi:MAG: hypothetical protein HQL69_02410 [Magnetococcales bacterium]|nr:hypothetical protein [Magnetococcales bacterium]